MHALINALYQPLLMNHATYCWTTIPACRPFNGCTYQYIFTPTASHHGLSLMPLQLLRLPTPGLRPMASWHPFKQTGRSSGLTSYCRLTATAHHRQQQQGQLPQPPPPPPPQQQQPQQQMSICRLGRGL